MSDWGATRIIVIEVGVYICLIGAQHVSLSVYLSQYLFVSTVT